MRMLSSLALLATMLALYWFLIRPKMATRYADFYAGADGFWACAAERLKGYRTLIVGFGGALLLESPDILAGLSGIDFTAFFGDGWGKRISQGIMLLMVFFRAKAKGPIGANP